MPMLVTIQYLDISSRQNYRRDPNAFWWHINKGFFCKARVLVIDLIKFAKRSTTWHSFFVQSKVLYQRTYRTTSWSQVCTGHASRWSLLYMLMWKERGKLNFDSRSFTRRVWFKGHVGIQEYYFDIFCMLDFLSYFFWRPKWPSFTHFCRLAMALRPLLKC